MMCRCVVMTLIFKLIYVFIDAWSVELVCKPLITHPIGLDRRYLI